MEQESIEDNDSQQGNQIAESPAFYNTMCTNIIFDPFIQNFSFKPYHK